ncbi:hypothetical protein ACFUIY_14625 [Streptomyces griseorubiginosus]|uniref:hypothetical protein n=1 Tax=Streptomyces griseorubiginosus TaxID=67304 RepID=UPI00363E1479
MSAPARPHIPTPGDLARSKKAPNATPAPAVAAEAEHSRTAEPAAEEARPVWQRPMYQPRKLTPEEAVKPGVLADTEYFRSTFRWCLTRSGLPPHARLVAHDLLHRANSKNGRIGPNNQPYTEQLALATGLTDRQAAVALQTLHTRGWLAYRPASPDDKQPLYDLVIPALDLERARGRRYLDQG